MNFYSDSLYVYPSHAPLNTHTSVPSSPPFLLSSLFFFFAFRSFSKLWHTTSSSALHFGLTLKNIRSGSWLAKHLSHSGEAWARSITVCLVRFSSSSKGTSSRGSSKAARRFTCWENKDYNSRIYTSDVAYNTWCVSNGWERRLKVSFRIIWYHFTLKLETQSW